MNIQIMNSFCTVSSENSLAHDLIRQVLTYRNNIHAEKMALLGQIQMAKRFKNKKMHDAAITKLKYLEANEWVCWYKNNQFPTGLLNIVKDVLLESNIPFELKDLRNSKVSSAGLKWLNKQYPLRYYQSEMVKLGLDNHRGVFESAVGTGKSLILSTLVYSLNTTSLIVVPSRGLVDQMYNELVRWFGSNKVGLVETKTVRSSRKLKPIRVCTIQTLAALQKSNDLEGAVGDIGAIFIDEIHHAGASSYLDLLPHIDHVYYRFGFTGTFLRNDGRVLDMWGFLSNVLYRYKAHQAISEGFLTPLEVKVYNLAGKRSNKYQTEYDKNYCGNSELLRKVHEIVADAVLEDKQVLILVNKKDKAGKIFHEYLNAYAVDNAYISGDNSKETISQTIRDFNDKKIQVLIGSSVIGEGIDVRSTDHLIMCQGGKSEIVMVQAIGRAVRLYEGKHIAYVHDFNFHNTRYMQKHLQQRVDIYKRNFECPVEFED